MRPIGQRDGEVVVQNLATGHFGPARDRSRPRTQRSDHALNGLHSPRGVQVGRHRDGEEGKVDGATLPELRVPCAKALER